MNQRTKKINFRGVVENHYLAADLLEFSGDAVIVERGIPRMLILRCPCGCGDDLLINLDRRSGPAWRLYQKGSGITLYPSYWRDSECGSHFIIWSGKIYWCFGWGSLDRDDDWGTVDSEIEGKVLHYLSFDEYQRYWTVADALDLLPWEVFLACHQLKSRGDVIEASGKEGGSFKRI